MGKKYTVSLEEKIEELKNHIERLQEEHVEIEELQGEPRYVRDSESSLRKRHGDLTVQNKNLKAEKAELEEEVSRLKDDLSRARIDNENLHRQRSILCSSVETANEEKQELRDQLALKTMAVVFRTDLEKATIRDCLDRIKVLITFPEYQVQEIKAGQGYLSVGGDDQDSWFQTCVAHEDIPSNLYHILRYPIDPAPYPDWEKDEVIKADVNDPDRGILTSVILTPGEVKGTWCLNEGWKYRSDQLSNVRRFKQVGEGNE